MYRTVTLKAFSNFGDIPNAVEAAILRGRVGTGATSVLYTFTARLTAGSPITPDRPATVNWRRKTERRNEVMDFTLEENLVLIEETSTDLMFVTFFIENGYAR